MLPLVLMTLLLVGAAAFAMSFKVTLDALAARSAVSAAAARAQAAGAIALGVLALDASFAAGLEPQGSLGPWPEHGVTGTVLVAAVGAVALEPEGTASVYSLVATATAGRATAQAEVVLYAAPELHVVYRRRLRKRVTAFVRTGPRSRVTAFVRTGPRPLDMPGRG